MHRKDINQVAHMVSKSSNNDSTTTVQASSSSSGLLKRKISDDDSSSSTSVKTKRQSPNSDIELLDNAATRVDPKQDPRGVYHVQKNVKLLMNSWGSIAPVPPDYFLHRLLESRGYSTSHIPAISTKIAPNPRQVHDYDNELVWAIRNSDLPRIKILYQSGRSMSACNKFSESIVHMACRRAELDVVDFILSHGGDVNLTDDYGRTPLHDACWRIEPRFDIVTMIMDLNLDLIRFADARGSTPLKYVREEHWTQWCAYLYHQREKYWAVSNIKVKSNSNSQQDASITSDQNCGLTSSSDNSSSSSFSSEATTTSGDSITLENKNENDDNARNHGVGNVHSTEVSLSSPKNRKNIDDNDSSCSSSNAPANPTSRTSPHLLVHSAAV